MINLPSGEYKVKAVIDDIEIVMQLKLSSEMFKLHITPFPNLNLCRYYEGSTSELEEIVVSKKLGNYSFEPMKSCVQCIIEEDKELSREMYDQIAKEDLVERLKTLIIQANKERTGNLQQQAEEEYETLLNSGRIEDLKTNYLINKFMNEISGNVVFYHVALNNFIKQYSYVRKDFFVEQLTVHTLQGTYYYRYLDDQFYGKIKYAGKIPSMMPYQQWMSQIEEPELSNLKDRLESDSDIPATEALMLVAKSLLERGEFRSAVIESSAALEVAVEEKLVEKLITMGRTQSEIDAFLADTQTNFRRRCDQQLNSCTGVSFVNNNSTLWNTINDHRKTYRHKIVHSTTIPPARKTEEIINDFEVAIRYIQSL